MEIIFFAITNLVIIISFFAIYHNLNKNKLSEQLNLLEQRQINLLNGIQTILFEQFLKFTNDNQKLQQEYNSQSNNQHLSNLENLQKFIRTGIEDITKSFDKLNRTTDEKLNLINDKVEERLNTGFEKTAETFKDIVKRLALIDAAQRQITELSNNVVTLQDILSDKRSRGAFGEVQLKNLISNTIPKEHFKLQHSLSNNTRVDCLLILPNPTGNIAIDSKFPLENYQILTNFDLPLSDRKSAEQSFKNDIKKHISDIATKYIIPGETSNGAIMFIPAEAIFAEIHRNFPDLITLAHKSNVWLASPTTMMAILTTASAVLKDNATKKHMHIMQKHLNLLAKDFERFDSRMNKLIKHLQQANDDAVSIQTSADKITKRFIQIEKHEIDQPELVE